MEFVKYTNYKSDEFKKVFTEYYKYEGITLRPDTTVFDEIEASANNNETFTYALIVNNEIKAFIMYQILELKTPNKFVSHRVGHIEELYVVEDYRNKHIATSLIKQVELDVKQNNVNLMFLTAEPKVFKVYEKLGYTLNSNYTCLNKLQCLTKQI